MHHARLAQFPASMAPERRGTCRLLDGTAIQAAGELNVTGDPIAAHLSVQGHSVKFDAVGIAAIRLDDRGDVEALACGGLKIPPQRRPRDRLGRTGRRCAMAHRARRLAGCIVGCRRISAGSTHLDYRGLVATADSETPFRKSERLVRAAAFGGACPDRFRSLDGTKRGGPGSNAVRLARETAGAGLVLGILLWFIAIQTKRPQRPRVREEKVGPRASMWQVPRSRSRIEAHRVESGPAMPRRARRFAPALARGPCWVTSTQRTAARRGTTTAGSCAILTED